MSLKYFKLRAFVKCQKREGKPYGFGAIQDLFCTGEEEYFHHCYWRQMTEWRMGKDKKMFQLQEAHLFALPVSLQLNYLSHEMNFPTEKTGRHRHTCSGEILHKHFSSTQEKQSGLRNKSPSLQVKRALCDTKTECNKLIFGRAIWQQGKTTAHSHPYTLLSGKMVWHTVVSKFTASIPTEKFCCLYSIKQL